MESGTGRVSQVFQPFLFVWTYMGLFVASIFVLYGAWMIIDTLVFGNPVRGYPSLLVSILFLGVACN